MFLVVSAGCFRAEPGVKRRAELLALFLGLQPEPGSLRRRRTSFCICRFLAERLRTHLVGAVVLQTLSLQVLGTSYRRDCYYNDRTSFFPVNRRPRLLPRSSRGRQKTEFIEGAQMANRKTIIGPLNRFRRPRRINAPQEEPRSSIKLLTLHQKLQRCRELALEWARKAERAENKELRDDCLRMEKSWINLARSYEFAMELLGKQELSATNNFGADVLPSSSVLRISASVRRKTAG